MGLKQFLGNLADKAGTLSANLGNAPVIGNLPAMRVAQQLGKERGISEFIAGNKPTVNTGVTPQSRAFGFTPYTPANMSNKSTALSISPAQRQSIANRNADIIQQKEQQSQSTQPDNIKDLSGLGMNLSGGGKSGGDKSAADIEQERKNEEFRSQLGSQYGDLRGKFGDILNTVGGQLRDLPNSIRELGKQYKAVIGEKQAQEIGQVGQKREQVAQQQKSGLQAIREDVASKIRSGASKLGNLAMGSSAAGMFQRAIENAGNKNAQDLLTQASNNYQQLDAEEARVKSAYKTMLDKLDAEEANNIKDIQDNAGQVIADVNKSLQDTGEFEKLDKEGLTTQYIQALTDRFQQAKQASDNYKRQLEQWRRQNESSIMDLKNKLVQDFIPKEITARELTGLQPSQPEQTPTEGLNPNMIRRLPEDETLSNPQNLQELTKRLRQRNTNL